MAERANGRLAGRTALVTGGGSGIGRESALLFAREGANVVVVDRDAAAGDATAAAIGRDGGRASACAADVARARDVEAAVAHAEQRFGALHVLFNNAGIFPARDGSPVDTDEAVWDQVMAVNLKGVFL